MSVVPYSRLCSTKGGKVWSSMYSPGILQLHKPTLNLGSSTEFEGPWASYLTSVRLNIFWGLLCELKEVKVKY